MGEERKELLNPLQRKIVASAITFAAGMLIFWLLLIVFQQLQALFTLFAPVLWPLAIATILSLLLRPFVRILENKLKLSRIKSIALLYATVTIVYVGLMSIILPIIIIQFIDLFDFLSAFNVEKAINKLGRFAPAELETYLERFSKEINVQEYLDSILEKMHEFISSSLPAITGTGLWFFKWIFNFFGIAASAAIIPVYLFYFLESDAHPTADLDEHLSFIKPEIKEDILFLTNEFVSIVVAFFRGQIVIGLIMGCLLAIGFYIVGLKFALLLGLMIGLLNIVPYLGTILGLGSAIPLAYFQVDGGIGLVGLSLLVFGIVQVIEGYQLTPKIMGKQTGLHPVTVIVSIFFWGTALDGLLGMIMAIPLTAFFIIAWRLIRKKYLDKFASSTSENELESSPAA